MHRTRLTRIAAAAVASALVLVGLVAAPAQAYTTGVISGRVSSPVAPGVDSYVAAVTTTGALAATSTISPGGSFTLKVKQGSYHLEYILDNAGALVSPFYSGGAHAVMASPLTKVVATKVTKVAVTVPAGASIAGTVTWGATPPIGGGPKLTVYDASGTVMSSSGGYFSDGQYLIAGLPAGTYRIGATRDHNVPGFWGGSTLATATPITLTAGQAQTGIDISLPAYPSIEGALSFRYNDGHVVGIAGNVRFWDVDAAAFVAKGSAVDSYRQYLPPGRYQVLFEGSDPNYLNAAATWAGSVPTRAESPIYTLEMGDTVTGVDAIQSSGGRANVWIPGSGGQFDAQLLVHAPDDSWEPIGARTPMDVGPTPTFAMLPPGEYTVQYSPNGVDPKFDAGYLGGVGDIAAADTFTVTAGVTAQVSITPHVIPFAPFDRDIDGDGHADLIVRNGSGHVIVAYGNGTGGIRGTEVLTTQFNSSYRFVSGGDFSGGGNDDLLRGDKYGALFAIGDLKGTTTLVNVGTMIKWNTLSPLFGTGDFTGDGRGDLIGRDAAGRLQVCAGDGVGRCSTVTPLSSPLTPTWKAMTALFSPGDFDGDTFPDLVARDAAGTLWLYPGDGAGGILPRAQIASGFNGVPVIYSVGDFDGDGHSDLITRDTAGTMWRYAGDGAGGLLPRVKIVSGWGSLQVVG